MEKLIIKESINERIDSYLSKNTDYSRSKIVKMIEQKCILVNNKEIKNSYLLKEGDIIVISDYQEDEMNVEPENIPLDIVYEDEDVLVVNNHGTLVNALLYHSKSLSDVNG